VCFSLSLSRSKHGSRTEGLLKAFGRQIDEFMCTTHSPRRKIGLKLEAQLECDDDFESPVSLFLLLRRGGRTQGAEVQLAHLRLRWLDDVLTMFLPPTVPGTTLGYAQHRMDCRVYNSVVERKTRLSQGGSIFTQPIWVPAVAPYLQDAQVTRTTTLSSRIPLLGCG